jgi:WD40 repeat protein
MDHTQDVKRVIWHPVKDVCASCSYDNCIRLYHEDKDDWSNFCTLEQHSSTVWSICFDASGQRLVSCSDDKTVRIWTSESDQLTKWTCTATLSGFHDRPIYDVSWSMVNGVIAAAGGDDSITLFKEDHEGDSCPKVQNFQITAKQADAHANDVNCVQWNPSDGSLLASGSDDGTVKIWKFSDVL